MALQKDRKKTTSSAGFTTENTSYLHHYGVVGVQFGSSPLHFQVQPLLINLLFDGRKTLRNINSITLVSANLIFASWLPTILILIIFIGSRIRRRTSQKTVHIFCSWDKYISFGSSHRVFIGWRNTLFSPQSTNPHFLWLFIHILLLLGGRLWYA